MIKDYINYNQQSLIALATNIEINRMPLFQDQQWIITFHDIILIEINHINLQLCSKYCTLVAIKLKY